MDIITSNKVKLIRWLGGDPFILQHVQSRALITRDEYSRLVHIPDPADKTTELLDIFINKGKSSCLAFLALLKEDDVNKSMPELEEWIKTVKTTDQSLNTDVTQTDSVAGVRTHAQAKTQAVEFVDKNRENLVQRVSMVMPIADRLLSKKMMTMEKYNTIRNTSTSEEQMRTLYEVLNTGGPAVKEEFYQILKKNESFLVDDLEKKPTNT